LNPFLNIFKGLRSCARVNKLGLLLKAVDKLRAQQNRQAEDNYREAVLREFAKYQKR
jgi:hypothetical protein